MVSSNKYAAFVAMLIVVFLCASMSAAEGAPKKKKKWVKSKYGIGSLMMLSGDRGKMKKEYARETKSFHKVKKAANNDVFKVGNLAFEMKKKYGDPVVVVPGEKEGDAKWVYKAGTSDFLTGEKAFLVFGPDDTLKEWGVEPAKEQEEKPE